MTARATPTPVIPDLTFLTLLFVGTHYYAPFNTNPIHSDRKELYQSFLRIVYHAGLSLAGAGCGLQIRRRINAQQFDSA